MKHELLAGAASAAGFTGLTRRQIYRLVDEDMPKHVSAGRIVELNGMKVRVVTEFGNRSARA